jgi:bifunctional DNase/RNase
VVEVFVARLGLDATSQSFVVLLQEQGGDRVLPIWIGRPEAEAIHAQMSGEPRARPMTHDLARSLVVALGGTLDAVHITRVEDRTFYAELHLHRDGERFVIDGRPSDAIAVALRLDAPIFAAEALLQEMEIDGSEEEAPRVDEPDPTAESTPDFTAAQHDREREKEDLKRHLEQLRPEDLGKFRL